jgi:hypothetical protein
MNPQRRTLLAGGLPAAWASAAVPAWAQADATATATDQANLARVLYFLAPLPAFAAADFEAASQALLQRVNQLPALKMHLGALLARLTGAGFSSLPMPAQLAFLKSLQTTPEFRFVSNPAFGVFNQKMVWPRLGYGGASFHLGGYRNRGFDDISWLPAAVKKGS